MNEAHELSIHYIKFNMDELVRRAAESVGLTSAQCASVEKFSDGMYNKTFLFIMDDGTQVVGKVPNPNAGRAHYTTANEVATMDFARNELHNRVPKVPAWSSKAGDNSVGAENIIMKKVAGVQLSELWLAMGIKERFEVVKTISEGSIGCDLLNEDGSRTQHHRYAIDPSTGREFLDDGRTALEFDRGPWQSAEQYRSAVNLQEIAYLRIMKYLLPTDASITPAILWHPNLHTENIFVHPERPAEVSGIIDWQLSEILPLFEHARQPYFLDYDGPALTGLDPPDFPANFNKLSPSEKAKAQDLYLKMSLSALYRRFTYSTNRTLYNAIKFRESTSFDMLFLAQNLLIDGEALGMELMQSLKQSLGQMWPEKGTVRADQYDDVKGLLRQAKADLIDQLAHSEAEVVAWGKAWPFDS
ncbi:hypothetical protein BDW74DRAFT_185692 [Aspergillus multicolor]|uniref:aminoglycoside phosphotransferase family protein n=1 Tax=Aspergillus multicolor TaxID=41759 RepID=UPI003CCE5285